ncbi:hypothetical protein B0O80DRAFT_230456 [Mortierella sp. GBAus27b]|nr:hypothetical protein B0O80DRAFT_230456 [Mortierella sp. GBAus27b]
MSRDESTRMQMVTDTACERTAASRKKTSHQTFSEQIDQSSLQMRSHRPSSAKHHWLECTRIQSGPNTMATMKQRASVEGKKRGKNGSTRTRTRANPKKGSKKKKWQKPERNPFTPLGEALTATRPNHLVNRTSPCHAHHLGRTGRGHCLVPSLLHRTNTHHFETTPWSTWTPVASVPFDRHLVAPRKVLAISPTGLSRLGKTSNLVSHLPLTMELRASCIAT